MYTINFVPSQRTPNHIHGRTLQRILHSTCAENFSSHSSPDGNRLHRALTTDIIAMFVHICRLILNRYRCCDAGLLTVLTPLFVKRCFCVTRRPVNSHCSTNCVCRMLGYDKKLSPYVAADSMELSHAILLHCEYVSRLIQRSVPQLLTFNKIRWICSYYECDYSPALLCYPPPGQSPLLCESCLPHAWV